MNTKIWKMIFIIEDDNYEEWLPKETFRQTELLGEKDWKPRLIQAVQDEQLNEDTIEKYNLNNKEVINSLTTNNIIEIFEYDGYIVDYKFVNV